MNLLNTNTLRKSFYSKLAFFPLLLAIAFGACTSEHYEGSFMLDEAGKKYFPVEDTLYYRNQDNLLDTLILENDEDYMEQNFWYSSSFLHETRYVGDFQHLFKSYSGPVFEIRYHLHIQNTGSGYWNYFYFGTNPYPYGDHTGYRVTITGIATRWPTFQEADSVILNDSLYTDVYYHTEKGKKFYFQAGKGLIGLPYENDYWTLVKK